MDDKFISDLSDLRVKLQAELIKALPPNLGKALEDLYLSVFFGT